MPRIATTLVLAAALGAPAFAQLGAPYPTTAPISIDVGQSLFQATGSLWPGVVGAARDANGHYWVTVRRSEREDPQFPHMLFELDGRGVVVGSHAQPQETASSRYGLRDLAYDGQYLYGGCESDRIFVFELNRRFFDPARTIPLPAGLTFSTVRALTFDPAGDSGRGSLWMANWSSEHVEIDLRGNILRRTPNLQEETFGAALDPDRRTVWWFGQTGSSRGANVRVVATEMDLVTLAPTGSRFHGDLGISALEPGGFAGGVEFSRVQGEAVLVLTVQGDTDWIRVVRSRFLVGDSSGGDLRMSGDAAYVGNRDFGLVLDRSSRDYVGLAFGIGAATVPLGGPSFAAGTVLHLDLGLPFDISPFLRTNAGSARMPFPLPNLPAIGGVDLWFQWIEIPSNGGIPTLPIATSKAGSVRILP